MFLTMKYRLSPSRAKRRRLTKLVDDQRLLYNAALEERIDCYRKTGKSLSYFDQCKSLTECRREVPEMREFPAHLQRGTLKRLDNAFKSFYRRVKARGAKAGFPRFKGHGWFDTLEFAEFSGVTFDGKHLRSRAFGSLRVHMHRPMQGDVKSCKIVRDGGNWHVCFQVEVEAPPRKVVKSAVGLDVGLTRLATLSTGENIPSIKAAKRAEKELRRRQRHLARCRRGSSGRHKVREEVAACHRKVRNVRRTCAHQQSAALVANYDLIAVENLNVNGLARSRHAKGVHDAGWSTFVAMLSYKAERAGGTLIRVDPKYTSQDCSSCGERVPKGLRERRHDCPSCGLSLDRDHNAAINILRKALGGVVIPGERNVAGCGERARGNIALLEKSE
ncbi:MAG: IS200/IS605 family element transposase accessory protein TnpB [Boseongicola sp. SB0675_bin_26]|nr:IS200/IS605 family element transposase accessory protein TnpB [Boseongicola sp. SB0675_bin_26]